MECSGERVGYLARLTSIFLGPPILGSDQHVPLNYFKKKRASERARHESIERSVVVSFSIFFFASQPKKILLSSRSHDQEEEEEEEEEEIAC
jgi:ribosomal protein S1